MAKTWHLICFLLGLSLFVATLMLAANMPGCASGDLVVFKADLRREVTATAPASQPSDEATVRDLVIEGLQ